jgi:hypothetical protein
VATCSSIINRALRKLGRLGAGRDARQQDAQDALDALRGLYSSWVASGAFGRMSDIIVNADATAGENQRIVRPADVTAEITLPEAYDSAQGYPPPPYGQAWQSPVLFEGINPNIRPPRDGASVSVIDQATGTAQSWLYDGFVKRWVSIDSLTLTSEAPISGADPEGLAACLAVEVADQFSADIPPATVRAAARFMWSMTNRASQPREIGQGAYF